MRLTKVTIHNLGPHNDISFDIAPTGVSAITGTNDAGKTSILRTIGWLLSTGKNAYGDKSLITDGTTEGYIETKFLDNNNEKHTVKKGMSNTKKVLDTYIYLDGQKISATEWADYLSSTFAPMEEVLPIIMGAQESIHQIIRDKKANRFNMFMELLGLTALTDIHENLKKEIAKIGRASCRERVLRLV